ncbi:MAG: hypothetical protein KKB02_04415 [Alphaproteobacteria bacterium]|nr:hypothetical protein [Alphaproteobacteria bacterium]
MEHDPIIELLDLPEPHEPQTTEEEFKAGPDFAGIAERLDQMDRLSSDGWWGHVGSNNGENETVLRAVGPVVGRAAASENDWDLKIRLSPTADLLEAVVFQLDWYSSTTAGEAPGISEWSYRVRQELLLLAGAVERHRGDKVN